MTDRTEFISRMIDGSCVPHEYDENALKAERDRLTRKHPFHGKRLIDTMPGGPDRLAAIEERLEQGHPGKVESNYARLAREAIEREDEAELDMQPPSSNLQELCASSSAKRRSHSSGEVSLFG